MPTKLSVADKYLAEHIPMSGSEFHDVCLGDADFDNVSFIRAKINNANMSDVSIAWFQMGGAKFYKGGSSPKYNQKPISFEECDLVATKFAKCDLSNTSIENCNISGLIIDGIPVEDMIKVYKDNLKKK